MSYDRWPPSPEPQRLAEPAYAPDDDRLDGGRHLDDPRYLHHERVEPRAVSRSTVADRGSRTGRGGVEPDRRDRVEPGHRDPVRPGRPGPIGPGRRDAVEPGHSGVPGDNGYEPRGRRRGVHRRTHRRHRLVLAVLTIVVLVGAIGFLVVRGLGEEPESRSGAAAPGTGTDGSTATEPTQQAVDPSGVPQTGPGTFAYATGTGKTLGTAGTLRKFQVAVEKQSGQDANAFAAAVDRILGDDRGWTAGGKYRFQRVPSGATHDFVVYLATPATSEKMCAAGGLHTDKYASCRLPGQVIINLARWLGGVPDYGAPLDVYQAYAVNHEIGHQLGFSHEACPGPGQAAPVMQQQTLGLGGCVANAWPYVGGVRLAGPPIP